MNVGTSPPDNLRVHIIPVGAGSCYVIECPGSDDVIINDCGQRGGTSPASWPVDEIKDYVASVVGDDRPSVIISHPHSDHYSYIPKIVNPKTVEAVLFGGDEGKFPQRMINWLASVPAGALRFGWEAGFHEEVPELACGAAKVHMVTVNIPPDPDGSRENANSLVLAIHHGEHVVVLPGDAEGATQDSALKNAPDLLQGVTLLAAPHHGSESHGSNQGNWPQTLSPNIVVYSAGVIDGHPRAAVVPNYQHNLLEAESHPMWESPDRHDERKYDSTQAEYVTELNGLIVFESDGKSVGLVRQFQDAPCF